MELIEIMTRDVSTVRPTDLAGEAFEVMREGRFRHLPVVDDEGHLHGVLSDRDIRNVTILFDRNPDDENDYMIFGPVKVEDIMVRIPITLNVTDSVERACSSGAYRPGPVARGDTCIRRLKTSAPLAV